MKIKLKKFKIVKSTNDIAIKLIKKNISGPILITTQRQTGGRGRIGKKWVSKKGNLFITLFLKLDKIKINYRQFAVLNAFLLKKLISKIVQKKITIKWPNDLLFNKHKFCGILQETLFLNKKKYIIVGIGINLSQSPKIEGYKTTHFSVFSKKKITKSIICNSLKNNYENNVERFL